MGGYGKQGVATLRISIPTDLRPPEARKATLLTLRARPPTLAGFEPRWVGIASRAWPRCASASPSACARPRRAWPRR